MSKKKTPKAKLTEEEFKESFRSLLRKYAKATMDSWKKWAEDDDYLILHGTGVVDEAIRTLEAVVALKGPMADRAKRAAEGLRGMRKVHA